MIATGVIGFFAILAFRSIQQAEQKLVPISYRVGSRLEKLWDIAQSGMREKKYLRAEKALLTILKLDERNAAAYNRLGILYSRQKEYRDAIECFEIASSIEPSASSLHNLGLIYYETENYDRAGKAFEAALKLEDNLAARHIAYAKVKEKLGDEKSMVHSLEHAVALEPTPQSYRLLATAYRSTGDEEQAAIVEAKLSRLIIPSSKPRRVRRAKRVIY